MLGNEGIRTSSTLTITDPTPSSPKVCLLVGPLEFLRPNASAWRFDM
nr:hypothetical protein Iba_scaffold181929CG0010 [Ipomoea batatas]